MPIHVVNRYDNQDLDISAEHSARLSDFVSRGGGKPFTRQVDAWWLAILLGVQMGLRTELIGKTTKFNDGAILSTNPWRITHLELLAVSEEGVEVLQRPTQVIRIATEYANTGFDWMFEQMLGEAEPILTLTNRLGEFTAQET